MQGVENWQAKMKSQHIKYAGKVVLSEECTSLRLVKFKAKGGGGVRMVAQPALGIEENEQKIKHD